MLRLLSSIVRNVISVSKIIFGHVLSPHHSDEMSQGSQVSRIALSGCSLNGIVISFLDTELNILHKRFNCKMLVVILRRVESKLWKIPDNEGGDWKFDCLVS